MSITYANRTTTFHEEATDSAIHTYICATFPIETHRNCRRIPTGLCSAHNKSHAHKKEQGSRAPSETKSRKWVWRNYRARGRPCRRRRGWWFLASPSREWSALDVGARGETKNPEMEIALGPGKFNLSGLRFVPLLWEATRPEYIPIASAFILN